MTLEEAKKIFEIQGNELFDKDVIKKKFKILASKYHPDTGGSEEAFKEFQSAYQLLLEYKGDAFVLDDLVARTFQDFINNFVKQGVINPSQVWKEYDSTFYRWKYPNGLNYGDINEFNKWYSSIPKSDEKQKQDVVSLTVKISKADLMSKSVFPNEQKIKEMLYGGLIRQLPKGKSLPADWENYLTRQSNVISFWVIFKYNGPIVGL